MSLYRRGKTWWCDVVIDGVRYRKSTGERKEGAARTWESTFSADVKKRGGLPRQAPTLAAWSVKFLQWVADADLDHDTRRYYRNGWLRYAHTPLAQMRLDRITPAAILAVKLEGSQSWVNQGRRTLSRMLSVAEQEGVLEKHVRVPVPREQSRDGYMDRHMESALLAVAAQPLRDVVVIMRDTGLRPEEVFRMRWEHVMWEQRLIYNPHGKSSNAKRYVPMSERVLELLRDRVRETQAEWVFPSPKSATGHLVTVARQFSEARVAASLPGWLVLYHARHAFATDAMRGTKDPFAVMKAMGHGRVTTTQIYQHPELDQVREAINRRNGQVQ